MVATGWKSAAGPVFFQGRRRQFGAGAVPPGAGARPRALRRRAGGARRSRRPSTSRRTPPNSSRSNTRICRSSWMRARRSLASRRPCARGDAGQSALRIRVRRQRTAPSRRLPRRRTSSASTSPRSASPAIRWSRSPASRAYDAATDDASRSASRPRASRTSRPRSAQITGLDAEQIPHPLQRRRRRLRRAQRSLSGIPRGDAGGEARRQAGANGPARARRRSPAIITRRGADLTGELALDDKGRFLGAARRVAGQPRRLLLRAPARSSTPSRRRPARRPASTRCRRVYGRHRLVFTNTTPITAYRGAGRPNVAYLWERLVEEAAATLGIDPVELRRRNILSKTAFPIKTLTGSHLRQRRSGAAARHGAGGGRLGRLQGAPQGGEEERQAARHRACDVPRAVRRRSARSRSRSASSRTASWRCIPTPVRWGRGTRPCSRRWSPRCSACPRTGSSCASTTSRRPKLVGTGSFGSRSLISHGAALMNGAKEIVEKGKELAAGELEVVAGRRDVRERRLQGGRHRPVDQHPNADREEMGPARRIRSTPT